MLKRRLLGKSAQEDIFGLDVMVDDQVDGSPELRAGLPRTRVGLLNPKGLEVFSCECYRILSRTIKSLLPPENLSAID